MRRREGPRPEVMPREENYEQMTRFLEKLSFNPDMDERIDWFKSLDFDQSMDMLSVMNGMLTGKEKFQRWNGEITKSVVSMGGNTESLLLEPPDDAHLEFKKVVDEVKEELSSETVKQSAAKIYFGVLFAHMFADGNGRLARNVYSLMTLGDLPKKELTTKRLEGVTNIAYAVNSEAILLTMEAHGMDMESPRSQVATTDGTSFSDLDMLKYIAARDVLVAHGKNPGQRIELNDLSADERTEFDQAYNEILKEWYKNAQNVVENDEYSEAIIKELDKIVA